MRRLMCSLVVLGAAGCGGAGGNYYWGGDDGGPFWFGDDAGLPDERDLRMANPGKPDLAKPPKNADLTMVEEPADLAQPDEPVDLAKPKNADLATPKNADLAQPAMGKGAVGDPCTADNQCAGVGARCIKDAQGWPKGYCSIFGCKQGTCPNGSDCYQTQNGDTLCLKLCQQKGECRAEYACESFNACVPGCVDDNDCDNGEVCDKQELVCKKAPCTPNSCGQGMKCVNGQCIPDVMGGPPPGPGPACNNLPPRDCVGDNTYCGALIQYNPAMGPGYDDYAINGETLQNQYRSWARRDLTMLIKYAAAYVDCKAAGWNWGNKMPIGLGDMSEKNGAIPGTSIGQPGHPQGTHVNGYDTDIAYYQMKGPNNYLREICPHTKNGQEQYHCTAAPDNFDLWRNALFIGALFSSGRVRVLGVDGQVGALIEKAMPTLCAQGWLPQVSCQKIGKLAYEVTDMGRGWFQFHHHHMHISLNNGLGMSAPAPGHDHCLGADCFAPGAKLKIVPGHQFSVNPLPRADLTY